MASRNHNASATQPGELLDVTGAAGLLDVSTNWLRVLSDEKPLKAWAVSRGKINLLNPVSDSWTGSGVVAGFLTGVSLVQLSH